LLRRAAKDTVQILSRLQAAYPEAATPQQEALHELLGPINERITARAISLLAEGDAEALGEDTTCIACMDLQRNTWGGTLHRRQKRCRNEILCIACVLVQHVSRSGQASTSSAAPLQERVHDLH